MKKIKVLTAVCILLLITVIGCTNQPPHIVKNSPSPSPKKPEPVIIEVAAVGDFLMHMPVIYAAWNSNTGNYDFASQLTDVKDYLTSPDLTIANLETRLAGKENGGFTGYPKFNCPEQLAFDLKKVGVDVVTTANNHSLDRGFKGLVKTLEHLERAGLKPVGNYKTAEARKPLMVDVRGIKIGILNYTETTNGIPIPKGKEFAVNMINIDNIAADIEQLQKQNADIIIAYLHFGMEYQRYPSKQQKELVNQLFNLGVDIIFGDHAHVIQPMEKQRVMYNGKEKETFVIYSLGNFISNQRWRYSDSGVIVNVQLEKDWEKNITRIKKIDYIPTWVHVYWAEGRKKYRVVPVEKAISDYEQQLDSTISAGDYSRLKQVWQETTLHLTKEEQNIYPRAVQ